MWWQSRPHYTTNTASGQVCDGVGSGLVRAIPDTLREKDSRGTFIALSGEELAQRAGDTMTRQNDIADAVRRLREKIEAALLEEVNVCCTRRNVIMNDRRYGYRLSSNITVRDAHDVRSDVKSDVKSDPNRNADDVRNDVRTGPDDVRNPSARQQWILGELAAKGAMRKDQVFAGYKKQFGLSKTTLERDLNALRRRGLIRFEGEKRTDRWRRV